MEQLIGDQWRQWGFVKIFVAAFLLYFILRLLRHSLKILNLKYGSKLPYQKIFPGLEMIIWISFIYWSLKEVINEPLYYSIFFTAISIMFLAWIGWYAGRDYIAGIIWRSQDVYEKGQKLIINKINGTIIKIGYLNIELEKNDGSVIKIPYSKIAGSIHSNKSENKLVSTHTFTLEVNQAENASGFMEKIRWNLINSPWHISYLEPQIKKIGENENKATLEIVVYSIGDDGTEKLQMLINKQFASGKL